MIVRARFKEIDVPIELRGEVHAEARALALAYAVEAAVEDGRYKSVAEVARAMGVSRARMSQLMRRRWAEVEQQERLLGGQLPGGRT